MVLFFYIVGWPLFIYGVFSLFNTYMQFLSKDHTFVYSVFCMDATLTILVGAVMIGIGAILTRLEPPKQEDATEIGDRQEPRLLSANQEAVG